MVKKFLLFFKKSYYREFKIIFYVVLYFIFLTNKFVYSLDQGRCCAVLNILTFLFIFDFFLAQLLGLGYERVAAWESFFNVFSIFSWDVWRIWGDVCFPCENISNAVMSKFDICKNLARCHSFVGIKTYLLYLTTDAPPCIKSRYFWLNVILIRGQNSAMYCHPVTFSGVLPLVFFLLLARLWLPRPVACSPFVAIMIVKAFSYCFDQMDFAIPC